MKVPKAWAEYLDWFNTGEAQVVDEALTDLSKRKILWCPGRPSLFRALDLCSPSSVRVVICGQDPYPDLRYATGLAFSVPPELKQLPPTLGNILTELQNDVNVSLVSGDLSRWCREEGVLLWNANLSCVVGKSNSHRWPEYEALTSELFCKLSTNKIVFCFLGSTAKYYEKYVDTDKSSVVWTSHPSPRNNINKNKIKNPFLGSRIFSRINVELRKLGKSTVDWRLK